MDLRVEHNRIFDRSSVQTEECEDENEEFEDN